VTSVVMDLEERTLWLTDGPHVTPVRRHHPDADPDRDAVVAHTPLTPSLAHNAP